MYVPTPDETVDAMLKVAKVGKEDLVYDLGSGDGRIPIMAVQKYNAARAVGIDINPERIKEAQANHKAAGVGDRVRFLNEDLFEANISEATVVTLYLLPSLNLKLLPKLLAELKPEPVSSRTPSTWAIGNLNRRSKPMGAPCISGRFRPRERPNTMLPLQRQIKSDRLDHQTRRRITRSRKGLDG